MSNDRGDVIILLYVFFADTIPGRQCMASCFFLLTQFEDALVYLNSIKVRLFLHPLPHAKILRWSKFKRFADDSLILAQIMRFVFYRIENTVGKGENADIHHFLPFP